MYDGVFVYFYNLFYYMEDFGILDFFNLFYLVVFYYLFCLEINRKFVFWSDVWVRYRLCIVKLILLILWILG